MSPISEEDKEVSPFDLSAEAANNSIYAKESELDIQRAKNNRTMAHNKAMLAHSKAAEAQKKDGNKKQASYHEAKAKEHRDCIATGVGM
jgi:hypothetical protein